MDTKVLYKKMEHLCNLLTNDTRDDLFKQGLTIIVEYRNSGGDQQTAYDVIHKLHLNFMDIDEPKMDLVDDWLDCIYGWYSGMNIFDCQIPVCRGD